MVTVDTFPDVEVMLVGAMAPLFPDYRFVTILPENIVKTTCRFKRISGAARDIRIDRPIVDADVFTAGYTDLAAREIQAALLSLRGRPLMNGVVQSVIVNVGPHWLPDPNPNLFRFNATYEIHIHS